MSHKGEKATSCQDCFERGVWIREYLPPNSWSLWSGSTYYGYEAIGLDVPQCVSSDLQSVTVSHSEKKTV